jgi:23S rRNA (cytosine1962-C5)-methyltransferase
MFPDQSALPPLRLKRREERRLRAGHLWVYSNEVDVAQTPLSAFEPGQVVDIQASDGRSLGSGYVNPHSLICARLVGRDPRYPLNTSLLVHRLKVALSLRERLFEQPYYRLVYGEADGLPGLAVDRYGDVLVVQITTAGMERMRDGIATALDKVIRPRSVLLRNDSPMREMEGLERYVEPLRGTPPEEVEVLENGVRFLIDLYGGQKTGWFYDQRDNRVRLRRYVPGRRVLDLFSYVGGWGVQAAVFGASAVTCVDASSAALDRVEAAAGLNRVEDRVDVRCGDVFDVLRRLREEGERFDVVIVDPPAFIKRRKDVKEGMLAYRRINQLAMQVMERDGILVSCSCSFHMQAGMLRDAIQKAGRHLGRDVQLLEQGHQGPDHPVHPAIPETDYLKVFYARVTRA